MTVRKSCWNVEVKPNKNHYYRWSADDQTDLWEVNTTDRPSLMMLRMAFHKARLALGSMPVVGSSCEQESTDCYVMLDEWDRCFMKETVVLDWPGRPQVDLLWERWQWTVSSCFLHCSFLQLCPRTLPSPAFWFPTLPPSGINIKRSFTLINDKQLETIFFFH